MKEITPAIIQAHMDVIRVFHIPIANTSENRKKLEEHICKICCKVGCTGRGRCRATDKTMAQINLLTPIVSIKDEGSRELGIDGFDRVITIGEALEPFNITFSEYFLENDGEKEKLHASLCLAKNKDPSIRLGSIHIPKEYNVKVNKMFD